MRYCPLNHYHLCTHLFNRALNTLDLSSNNIRTPGAAALAAALRELVQMGFEEAVARVGASVIDSLFAEDVVTNVPGERLARILFMLGRDVVAGLDGKRLGPAAGDIIARAKQMIDSGGPYGRPAFEQWVPSVVAVVNGPGGS